MPVPRTRAFDSRDGESSMTVNELENGEFTIEVSEGKGKGKSITISRAEARKFARFMLKR